MWKNSKTFQKEAQNFSQDFGNFLVGNLSDFPQIFGTKPTGSAPLSSEGKFYLFIYLFKDFFLNRKPMKWTWMVSLNFNLFWKDSCRVNLLEGDCGKSTCESAVTEERHLQSGQLLSHVHTHTHCFESKPGLRYSWTCPVLMEVAALQLPNTNSFFLLLLLIFLRKERVSI